jgi:hypothetical protein
LPEFPFCRPLPAPLRKNSRESQYFRGDKS